MQHPQFRNLTLDDFPLRKHPYVKLGRRRRREPSPDDPDMSLDDAPIIRPRRGGAKATVLERDEDTEQDAQPRDLGPLESSPETRLGSLDLDI